MKKSYGVNELRRMYLDFFESKGHLVMKSFSLVPHNDNSLLLINAGMAPLKPYFTGQPAYTVTSQEDIEKLPLKEGEKVCLVAQTTFNYNKFQELVEIIKKKGYDISVLDTICNATEERQTEARKIAAESDLMIVIGDKHSSNTQKLYEISKKECANTYYIQTSKDMDYHQIQSINNVGITAGASTPNNIIEEVSKNVRNEL